MRQHVLAIDFDDVLMQFNAGFVEYHNRHHGTRLSFEDIISYDMPLVYNCEEAVLIERVRAFYHSPDHAAIAPTPGAVAAIKKLRTKHHLEVVTSRSEALSEHTIALAELHFPGAFRQLHFTNGFAPSEGAVIRPKSHVCRDIGAVVLVDDALSHAAEAANSGLYALLLDRPWNRDHTPEGVVRVQSWEEVVNWVDTHL